jgi:hypothetical protein
LAVFGGSPLGRLVRLLRAGAASAGSEGGSLLGSRWAALRLREGAGGGCVGGGGGGGGGRFGGSPLAEPTDRLAAERVTLDDMRYCCKTLHARWLRQTEAPMAECAALPVESGEAVERQWRAWSRERERERETEKVGGEGMSVERAAVEKSGELFVPAVAVEVRPFTGF